jgi:acetate---CoA ligase (ADP-forming)
MSRDALHSMLEASSVAIVGASTRAGSLGWHALNELRHGGFEGRIYPVNPKYDDVDGLACYASIADVPEAVDLVVLGVANSRQAEQARAAADAGVRSLVIFASLYDEGDRRTETKDHVAEIARDAGMAVCGGNCMGFLNVERRVWATGFSTTDLEPGGISFISHSGSAFVAFAFSRRGLRFNLLVSPGQELTTTLADYLAYAVEQASTRAVGLLIEQIRDVPRFEEAMAVARSRDIPVVALKVGRVERAKPLITAHSGADAGEDEDYRELFERSGVIRVRTMQEMADTLELLAAGRFAPSGGLAAIHESGGERALLVDLAADRGIPWAEISTATRERLAAALDPGLEPVNPLDAWGAGIGQEDIFIECMRALLADDGVAALALAIDLVTEDDPEAGNIRVAKEIFASTQKPFMILANLPSAIEPRDAATLRAAGIPVLEEADAALAAIGHLFEYRDVRKR